TVDRVARTLAASRARWLPVLVDGLALAATARECVTIMRGNWSTARVVHTLRDTAARLTLDGARRVAGGVAAALFPGISSRVAGERASYKCHDRRLGSRPGPRRPPARLARLPFPPPRAGTPPAAAGRRGP